MVIMNDLEWPMFSYVIYYEKLKKVFQQTEKEAWSITSVTSQISIDSNVQNWLLLI